MRRRTRKGGRTSGVPSAEPSRRSGTSAAVSRQDDIPYRDMKFINTRQSPIESPEGSRFERGHIRSASMAGIQDTRSGGRKRPTASVSPTGFNQHENLTTTSQSPASFPTELSSPPTGRAVSDPGSPTPPVPVAVGDRDPIRWPRKPSKNRPHLTPLGPQPGPGVADRSRPKRRIRRSRPSIRSVTRPGTFRRREGMNRILLYETPTSGPAHETAMAGTDRRRETRGCTDHTRFAREARSDAR